MQVRSLVRAGLDVRKITRDDISQADYEAAHSKVHPVHILFEMYRGISGCGQVGPFNEAVWAGFAGQPSCFRSCTQATSVHALYV